MDILFVTGTLVQLHQEIQQKGGYAPAAIQATTCPLKDLPGFDSMLVPVIFRRLARAIGVVLPADFRVPNIYVGPDGRARLTIAEIAGAFCARFGKKAA
jgi:hypothetical protein